MQQFLREQTAAEPSGPATGPTALVLGAFREVLRLPVVRLSEDFFELGGHSLSISQVASRIEAAVGVRLSFRDFYEHSQLGKLCELVAARLGQAVASATEHPIQAQTQLQLQHQPLLAALQPRPPDLAQLPLSSAQRRLWLVDELLEGDLRSAYNVPTAYHFDTTLDPVRLQASLQALGKT